MSTTAAIMASWTYLHHINQERLREEARLRSQTGQNYNIPMVSTNTINSHPYQMVDRVNLRFGEPVSILTWLTTTVGAHAVGKGIDLLLKETKEKQPLFDLKKSSNYTTAIEQLEAAKKVSGDNQRARLELAEHAFVRAAADFELLYLKAECFKYAAICSKMAGQEPSLIRHYADRALGLYSDRKAGSELEQLKKKYAWISPKELAQVTILIPIAAPFYFLDQIFDPENQRVSNEVMDLGFKALGGLERGQMRMATTALFDSYCYSDLPDVCAELKKSPTS